MNRSRTKYGSVLTNKQGNRNLKKNTRYNKKRKLEYFGFIIQNERRTFWLKNVCQWFGLSRTKYKSCF